MILYHTVDESCAVFYFGILGGRKMIEKGFLNVSDVAQLMDISISMACKIIRNMNNELV